MKYMLRPIQTCEIVNELLHLYIFQTEKQGLLKF